MACLLLLAATVAGAQVEDDRDGIIQQMLRIVLDSNPGLSWQAELVRESEKLPSPRTRVAFTGLSLSVGTSIWDPDTGTFRVYPAVTLGTGLSIADPARVLNAFNLAKARTEARQEQLKLKNALIEDLLSAVRETLKLAGRRESLEKLKAYLQDYSDLIEKQVRAGVATPELDKLWELKERLLGIDADIGEVENQLETMRLEAALSLAGDSWRELLVLLTRLGGE
jgi:outer membrane protein TolC